MDPAWRERFLSTSRGRIVAFLRSGARTASELALTLEISDNAVREHLAALERDGLVAPSDVRREGVGKPPRLWESTAEAESLFPKAYDVVLASILGALEETLGDADAEDVLREAGRRAGKESGEAGSRASEQGAATDGDVDARLEAAMDVLTALGAELRAEHVPEGVRVSGVRCPLSAVVPRYPKLCCVIEALLEEVAGVPVEERCDRDPKRPRCAFLFRMPPEATIGK